MDEQTTARLARIEDQLGQLVPVIERLVPLLDLIEPYLATPRTAAGRKLLAVALGHRLTTGSKS